MMFNKNARELSELQLWEGLGKIPKVQRDTDVDSDELQRDLKSLLHSSVSCSLSDNLAQVTGGLVEYLENNLTSAMMDDDGSWLNDLGKIVARLWTVGLQHPRFQMAVHRRCQFLSAEGDPARVIEVTQQMVGQFEKAQQLFGISIPMGNGKSINVDGDEVPIGASAKSAGSSPKKTSSFIGRCDDCGKNGHKSGETAKNGPDVEETAFGKDVSSLTISLAAVTVAKCLVYLSREAEGGISDGCVAGTFKPDLSTERGRKRAMK